MVEQRQRRLGQVKYDLDSESEYRLLRKGPLVDRYEFVKRFVIQVCSGLSSPAGGRVPLRMPMAIAAYSS